MHVNTQEIMVSEGDRDCPAGGVINGVMLINAEGKKESWLHVKCPECPMEYYTRKT